MSGLVKLCSTRLVIGSGRDGGGSGLQGEPHHMMMETKTTVSRLNQTCGTGKVVRTRWEEHELETRATNEVLSFRFTLFFSSSGRELQAKGDEC